MNQIAQMNKTHVVDSSPCDDHMWKVQVQYDF